MSDIAIRVENLSKAYRIGLKEQQHETLLGAAAAFFRAPFKNFRELRNLSKFDNLQSQLLPEDVFWALKDVSFEVKRGEAVGVIGRNGAGKSTLLKVLSRITEPTQGRAEIFGRVASLLEVGTGFHPDLTGRENVYLNGTILGMRKREIDAKFDEIVAFSGVEQFIDTPVKRYSSGMRVRLAFSVAAHLEPEILVIDEVLAVGDAEFQKKCLGKMEDVASQGRTVIFVSHNMGAITRLCSRAISLEGGRVGRIGIPSFVVQAHLDGGLNSNFKITEVVDIGPLKLRRLGVEQNDNRDCALIDNSQPFTIVIEYSMDEPLADLLLGFDIVDAEGNLLFRTFDQELIGLGPRRPGTYHSRCLVPGGLLHPVMHHLNILVGIHRNRWLSKNSLTIKLDMIGSAQNDIDYPGLIRPLVKWQIEAVDQQVGVQLRT